LVLDLAVFNVRGIKDPTKAWRGTGKSGRFFLFCAGCLKVIFSIVSKVAASFSQPPHHLKVVQINLKISGLFTGKKIEKRVTNILTKSERRK
jgi:hypothetical protein